MNKILKLYEGKCVSTLIGYGYLVDYGEKTCKVRFHLVNSSDEVLDIATDTIIVDFRLWNLLSKDEWNHIGRLLMNDNSASFKKDNKDGCMIFTSSSWQFEISNNGCINSPHKLQNVVKAYMFLAENGYKIS